MRANEIQTGYTPQPAAKRKNRALRAGRAALGDSQHLRGGADGFMRTGRQGSEYTDYDRFGRYRDQGVRILPDRYYNGTISGNVYYKGGTVSYIDLLEEAVMSGEVVLDESRNPWDNVRAAEYALIESHASALYPWSTTLYSEDGQYRYRVENGQITGATRAFYEEPDGRRITAQYLAEQLASGIRPADLDGDWQFLANLDQELYDKACMIGKAKRIFQQKDEAFATRRISQEQYLEDVHLSLLYFLGKDEGLRGAAQLRRLIAAPEFGRKALEGSLTGSEAPQRRVISIEPPPIPKPSRTRRKLAPLA